MGRHTGLTRPITHRHLHLAGTGRRQYLRVAHVCVRGRGKMATGDKVMVGSVL